MVGAAQFQEVRDLQTRARTLELTIKRFEAGSVMGLSGHTLDTRQLVVAVALTTAKTGDACCHRPESTLWTEHCRIRRTLGTSFWYHQGYEHRTGITVTGKDALWFEGQKTPHIFR